MAIGVAIVGSGIFAKEQHLPAVQACSSLSLKAVYSRSLKSAQSLSENLSNVDLYSDDSGSGKSYQDLLQRDDIQGLIIALPIMKQAAFIEAALAAGKHVLSEKPIAQDLQTAEKLVQFYRSDKVKSGTIWAVAENLRFVKSIQVAAEEVKKLGKILGFRAKSFGNVAPGGKYIETAWRKVPEHQGGFLLDGGIHTVAAIRHILGENKPTTLASFNALLQAHLPPVDTVNSIWQTSSGISGTFAMSFGTTLSGSLHEIACEQGSVIVARDKVTVRKGNEGDNNVIFDQEFPDKSNGVVPEVAAWAKSIEQGKLDPLQSPEEGLADLEILEKMLVSGEKGGAPLPLQHQV
ncbi:hypothetical protein F5884DRAFT_65230 [Xylogone sp. PMI_703]|nr:hypothetical protein F5884DRAFT_65230 [Xylogone sp. PMI_703]